MQFIFINKFIKMMREQSNSQYDLGFDRNSNISDEKYTFYYLDDSIKLNDEYGPFNVGHRQEQTQMADSILKGQKKLKQDQQQTKMIYQLYELLLKGQKLQLQRYLFLRKQRKNLYYYWSLILKWIINKNKFYIKNKSSIKSKFHRPKIQHIALILLEVENLLDFLKNKLEDNKLLQLILQNSKEHPKKLMILLKSYHQFIKIVDSPQSYITNRKQSTQIDPRSNNRTDYWCRYITKIFQQEFQEKESNTNEFLNPKMKNNIQKFKKILEIPKFSAFLKTHFIDNGKLLKQINSIDKPIKKKIMIDSYHKFCAAVEDPSSFTSWNSKKKKQL